MCRLARAIVVAHGFLAYVDLIAIMMMRWKMLGGIRLVSILAAIALVLAHGVGGYAHAAGHKAAAHGVQSHAGAAIELAAADHGTTSKAHGPCDPGTGFSDACDFMCNGGIAILSAQALVFDAPEPVKLATVSSTTRLLLRVSLERPPKPSLPA